MVIQKMKIGKRELLILIRMKKLLSILAFVPLFAFCQDENSIFYDSSDVGWSISTEDSSLELFSSGLYDMGVKDSIASIEYQPDASDNKVCWWFTVCNLSKDPITIKWMKSQINGSRMLLGEMRRFQISQPIPDDIIYPGEHLLKQITSVNMAENYMIRPLYLYEAKKAFKKTKQPQYGEAKLVVCIEHNGIEKIYRFSYKGVYNGKRPKEKKK